MSSPSSLPFPCRAPRSMPTCSATRASGRIVWLAGRRTRAGLDRRGARTRRTEGLLAALLAGAPIRLRSCDARGRRRDATGHAAMVDSRASGDVRPDGADRRIGQRARGRILRAPRPCRSIAARILTAQHVAALQGAFARDPPPCWSPSTIRAARSSTTTSIRRPSRGRCGDPGGAQGPLAARRGAAIGPAGLAVRCGARGGVTCPAATSWPGWTAAKGRWLAISTPVTSWFTSTCERGPGIAGFPGDGAARRDALVRCRLVFVATSGHEVGHGGMEHFLHDGAPGPTPPWRGRISALRWPASAGAATAALDHRSPGRHPPALVLSSQTMESLVVPRFKDVVATPLVGPSDGIGELRDVLAAGYPRFFGMAGSHTFFHTPADAAATTDRRYWNGRPGLCGHPGWCRRPKSGLLAAYSFPDRGYPTAERGNSSGRERSLG